MTALLLIFGGVMVILAVALLLLVVRFLWHVEQERKAQHELQRASIALLERHTQRPAEGYVEFARTIERLAEKAIGNVPLAQQHSAERATSQEIAARAQGSNGAQAVGIPIEKLLDDEVPGPDFTYQPQG